MKRRDLLKIIPLAAIAAVPVQAAGVEAKAIGLSKDKRYVFVIENTHEKGEAVRDFGRELARYDIKGVVLIGKPELTVYELDTK